MNSEDEQLVVAISDDIDTVQEQEVPEEKGENNEQKEEEQIIEQKRNEITRVLRQLNWKSTDAVWISYIALLFLLPACYSDVSFGFSFTSILLHTYLLMELIFNLISIVDCTDNELSKLRLIVSSSLRGSTIGVFIEDIWVAENISDIYFSGVFITFTMLFSICWFQYVVYVVRLPSFSLKNIRWYDIVLFAAVHVTFYLMLYLPKLIVKTDVLFSTHIAFAAIALVFEYVMLLITLFIYRNTRLLKRQ